MFLQIAIWQNLVVYASLFLALAGFVGNILTYIIYWLFLYKNTISLYFLTISVVNTYHLLHMLRNSAKIKLDWDLRLTSDLACKITDFSHFGFNAIPGWLLVFISLDRLTNITNSKKFSFLCKRPFQWLLIIVLFMTQPMLYSYMVWKSRLELTAINMNDSWSNDSVSELACVNDALKLLSWIDLANSTILPFVLMTVLTIMLVYHIKNSRNKVNIQVTFKTTKKNESG